MALRTITAAVCLAVAIAACGRSYDDMTLREFTSLPQAEQLDMIGALPPDDAKALAIALSQLDDGTMSDSMTIRVAIGSGRTRFY